MRERSPFLAATAAACALFAGPPALAQHVNYERADRIRPFDPSLVGGQIRPVFLSDSIRFYYEAKGDGADRGALYLVDARIRSRRQMFDNARVATSLSALVSQSGD